MKPIVLLLGPSGVGKTTLGDEAEARLGMLHIPFDRSDMRDGVEVAGLRREWDAFLRDRMPHALAEAVQRRILEKGTAGGVISCSSEIVPACDWGAVPWHLPKPYLPVMASCGLRCAVLFGPHEACLDAAMGRIDGREVTVESWHKHNSTWYGQFQPAAFPELILEVFDRWNRRPIADVVKEFRRRFTA